jgi:hypothetical protein
MKKVLKFPPALTLPSTRQGKKDFSDFLNFFVFDPKVSKNPAVTGSRGD